MNRIAKVLRMEFKTTAANKAFIIITILGPFLLLLVTLVPSLIARNAATSDQSAVVGIIGGDGMFFDALDRTADQSTITFIRPTDRVEAESLVSEKKISSFIDIPESYLGTDKIGCL